MNKYEFQAIKFNAVFFLDGNVIDLEAYLSCLNAGVQGLTVERHETVIKTFSGSSLSKVKKEISTFKNENPFIEVRSVQG